MSTTQRARYEAILSSIANQDPCHIASSLANVGRALSERSIPPIVVRLSEGVLQVTVKINYKTLTFLQDTEFPCGVKMKIKPGERAAYATHRHALGNSLRRILECITRLPAYHTDVVISPDTRRGRIPRGVHATMPGLHENDDVRYSAAHADMTTCRCALPDTCDLCNKNKILIVDVLYYVSPDDFAKYMLPGRTVYALHWETLGKDTLAEGEATIITKDTGDQQVTWCDVGGPVSYTHPAFTIAAYTSDTVSATKLAGLFGYELWELKSGPPGPTKVTAEAGGQLQTPQEDAAGGQLQTPQEPDAAQNPDDHPDDGNQVGGVPEDAVDEGHFVRESWALALSDATKLTGVTTAVGRAPCANGTAKEDAAMNMYREFLAMSTTDKHGHTTLGSTVVQESMGQPTINKMKYLYERVPKFFPHFPAKAHGYILAILAVDAAMLQEYRSVYDDQVTANIRGHDSLINDPAMATNQAGLFSSLFNKLVHVWISRSRRANNAVYRTLTGEDLPLRPAAPM
jgi:hypothetical protein